MGCNVVLRLRFTVRNPPVLYLYYLFSFPTSSSPHRYQLLIALLIFHDSAPYFSLSLPPPPNKSLLTYCLLPPLPLSSPLLSLLKDEQMQLLKHISGLERQIGHQRAEREKLSAANKAVSVQQGRDNTCLRNNLAQVCHYL